jgi:hypothetical protein
MASSSGAPVQEWLVIAPDCEGALQKRLAVRDQHLQGLKADDEGFWLWGGELLFFFVNCSDLEWAACSFQQNFVVYRLPAVVYSSPT